MNLSVRLPAQENIDAYDANLKRKMYGRAFCMDCEKMIRDLEYYNSLSFITCNIQEDICNQLDHIKKGLNDLDPIYKDEINDYLMSIKTQIRIFRDKDIDGDYYINKDILFRKYKQHIDNSYATLYDMTVIRNDKNKNGFLT
jgi:hypothetical protein